MSSTAGDLVNETLAHLHSTHRDPLNRLASNINFSTTEVLLDFDLNAIQTGALLSVGLELMYVWDVNVAGKSATVQRGFQGTVAAGHFSGDLVTVNPKFPTYTVLNRINDDLDDLSANGLFSVYTETVTYSSSVNGYPLTYPNPIDILQVKYDESGPAKQWPEIKSWKLRRESDTDDFSSGTALVLYDAGQDGADVRITYAAPFPHFDTLEDLIINIALPETAWDLPPLGAAIRLQSAREPQRNFNEAQPAPRRAGEVQTGAQLQAAQGLRQIRRDRIRVEASRLRKAWPVKKRMPS